MDMGPFIPNEPNPTHKLSNPIQNVINTDPTKLNQPKLPNPMFAVGMCYFCQ